MKSYSSEENILKVTLTDDDGNAHTSDLATCNDFTDKDGTVLKSANDVASTIAEVLGKL